MKYIQLPAYLPTCLTRYTTIVVITLIMTVLDMTAGLAFCVICATLTFTLQESHFTSPIRGTMSGRTLKSSKWRSRAATDALESRVRNITVVQLQGMLFFGNGTTLLKDVTALIQAAPRPMWFLILDFTLVVGIDSSAADFIARVVTICQLHRIRLVYCRGSKEGFPTSFPLTETLRTGEGAAAVHVCDAMDEALAWCEDTLLAEHVPPSALVSFDVAELRRTRRHLWQLYCLCPHDDIPGLIKYFERRTVAPGTVLWEQGAVSTEAVLVVSGELTSRLEDEAGTEEAVLEGQLVGEYGLIHGQHRLSTVAAAGPADLLVLGRRDWERMQRVDPHLALLLAKICVGYLGRRVERVSNRIWESHCIPI